MAGGSGELGLTPTLVPVYVSREEQPQKKERLPLRAGAPDPSPQSPGVNPCGGPYIQAAGVVTAEGTGAGAQSRGLWWKHRGPQQDPRNAALCDPIGSFTARQHRPLRVTGHLCL